MQGVFLSRIAKCQTKAVSERAVAQQWINPVTVSRAHEWQRLSRDGMASVVELPSGQLLCVLESVHTAPPHVNCIRLVSSEDAGRT